MSSKKYRKSSSSIKLVLLHQIVTTLTPQSSTSPNPQRYLSGDRSWLVLMQFERGRSNQKWGFIVIASDSDAISITCNSTDCFSRTSFAMTKVTTISRFEYYEYK